MRGYIYSISCKIKDKDYEYIGSTLNFSRRMKEHKRLSKNKDRKIYNIIRKCGGWSFFECDIIDIENYKSVKELRKKELAIIKILAPNMNVLGC